MPSREQRRVKEKLQKKSSQLNQVEKKRTQHPVMWIFSVLVLVIVVVAFIIAPAFGGMGQSNRLIFGYYNGEAIEYTPDSYFARQRDAYAERVQNMAQNNSDNLQFQALQVWKAAYDATVVHTAVLQQAEKSGLHISNDRLDRTIAQFGPYQRNGKFSPELYRQASNAEKIATRELFEENLLQEQWEEDLRSIPASPGEADFFAGLATPERQFRYISYSLNDYPREEVAAFALENGKLFQRMNLSRISLRTKESEAEEIYSQLTAAPERFEELAQNHSSDESADKGGDLGRIQFHELAAIFEDEAKADQIFSLENGEISELIETSFGWAIYRSDSTAEQADLTDPNELDTVRSYLIQNRRGDVENYFIDRANVFIENARTDGFSTAAAGNDLDVRTTNYFPINYGGSFFLKTIQSEDNNGLLGNAQSNSRILKTLFALEEESYTEPFVLGQAIVVAQLIDERTVPAEELEGIKSYYSYITSNFQNQDIQRHFLQSEKFEDNFMQIFSKYFLNS